ncbi:DUF86 domain-containing protein [Exiguobacterium sp. OS-77]|uniref:type VII toxin-antitoxin system HepT family RNase toxin n=1 Tax=Exiguobacterium sp. OS-77 TaxID=1241306 RepID=UPI00055162BE|nr:DUF86 domain-containing protein [Exiguobacterium sp. OS-77]
MNDVLLNKIATIERCLLRIQDVYQNEPSHLKDYTKQDSIILNIQRACEASINIAMHLVRTRKLGLPKSSRDGFHLLEEAQLIDASLATSLMNMVGFRNIAVHDYQSLNLDILQAILDRHLNDFLTFTRTVIELED